MPFCNLLDILQSAIIMYMQRLWRLYSTLNLGLKTNYCKIILSGLNFTFPDQRRTVKVSRLNRINKVMVRVRMVRVRDRVSASVRVSNLLLQAVGYRVRGCAVLQVPFVCHIFR